MVLLLYNVRFCCSFCAMILLLFKTMVLLLFNMMILLLHCAITQLLLEIWLCCLAQCFFVSGELVFLFVD